MQITRTVLLVLSVVLSAQVPSRAANPIIETVVPSVGPRGGEFTVVLSGGRLQGAKELLIYRPGLSCRKLEVVSENEVHATLAFEPNCSIGAFPFRLRTAGGLSELKVVHATPFAVISEVEPNDDPKRAQEIPPDTTVAGVVESGDVDCFAVMLRKGEHFAAEVQAIRLGGDMTDTILAIRAPDGHEIARVDDAPLTRQDPFVSLAAPEDGVYTIQVRETSFGGGPGSTYALHVGNFPRPSAIFPPGAQAGKPARFRLIGIPGENFAETVSVPNDGGPWWDFRPELDGRSAPTCSRLRVRPYGGVEEPDLSESSAPAVEGLKAHAWPIAFYGAIGSQGDVDAYAIQAQSGDRIQIEAFAERLGAPLDTVLEVFDADGLLVARNDDDETHDSRLVIHVQDAGTYRIEIRDRRQEGGRDFVYRIEVEEPRPALELFLATPNRKSQAGQAIAVPRGNRVAAYLGVRRDGFEGPVHIDASGLPPGIMLDVQDIRADTYLTPVLFAAAADAPLGAALANLRGTASTRDGTVKGEFRQLVDLLPGLGDSSFQSETVGSLAVVVTEEAPYRVTLSAPATPLARSGAIDVVAKVDRSKGFDEAIEVALPYLPPGTEMDGPGIVAREATETTLRIFARPDADPVHWRLAAEARPAPPRRDRRELTLALMAQIDPGRRRKAPAEGLPLVASAFVPLELARAPLSGVFTPAASEQGGHVKVTCRIDGISPFERPMIAALEGLPPRATAEPVEISAGARQVEFRVAVAPTTPLGEFDSLECRLSGEIGGHAVLYRVGRGGRLKVSAPGALAIDAEGKPLSPLDALRQRERAAADANR
jgi:hypothetical protein